MEWLFGSSAAAPPVSAKLSASTSQGRSAPSRGDDSQHKIRGNALFKAKDYEAAIREYSLGIERTATATLHSNRSAAYCALGRYPQAKADADAAIALDPEWAKTYSRKGKALYGMSSFRKAADAYARGLELCLRGATGEAQQRDTELEALKRQTDSQAETYLRLLEENSQLKRQLEDYQHMFGEWTKKEM
ncbi:Stress-induced-phosphoprotein 1 [Phytophthora pseudosyringae]|uniref:Stress-induced-phosphoprotein 1 n=1 Tax=Phytophthora pseudosyringae TaxID=221518 RepID=A0A8T1VMR7_9STRA|nr:Stress-induced-phosphoprotein 1 [Phytophthora pseudosyringae]